MTISGFAVYVLPSSCDQLRITSKKLCSLIAGDIRPALLEEALQLLQGLCRDRSEDLGHLGADVCRAVDDVDAALAHHALLGFGRLVFS